VVEELSSEIERLKADRKGADILVAQSQSELHGQLHDDLTARLNELQTEVTSLRHQNKSMLMCWLLDSKECCLICGKVILIAIL
jgi:chaperonin cofactor prefoldin